MTTTPQLPALPAGAARWAERFLVAMSALVATAVVSLFVLTMAVEQILPKVGTDGPAAAAPAASRCDQGFVALSFDDGPDPEVTPHILETLERHNVKATFFVVGQRVTAYPHLTRAAHQAGHLVGNHTWSHPHVDQVPDDEIASEVRRTTDAIVNAGVPSPALFRPPYGETTPRFAAEVQAAGLRTTTWTDQLDTKDAELRAPDTIRSTVVDHLVPGGVILAHDFGTGGANTAAALDGLIDAVQTKGYCFARLDQPGVNWNTFTAWDPTTGGDDPHARDGEPTAPEPPAPGTTAPTPPPPAPNSGPVPAITTADGLATAADDHENAPSYANEQSAPPAQAPKPNPTPPPTTTAPTTTTTTTTTTATRKPATPSGSQPPSPDGAPSRRRGPADA